MALRETLIPPFRLVDNTKWEWNRNKANNVLRKVSHYCLGKGIPTFTDHGVGDILLIFFFFFYPFAVTGNLEGVK